jgi:hypothetical protein
MGFFEQTFQQIDGLVANLTGATMEEVIEIYDELKLIRRDICRNPDTRKSYLSPRVMSALRKARDAIAIRKKEAIYDIQKQVPQQVDLLQVCHSSVVILAILAFYVLVLSTGRV